MGLNLKEKFQKITKKHVCMTLLVVLVATLVGLGVYEFKAVKDAKKVQEVAQQSISESASQGENVKKPSEYEAGLDYNVAIQKGKPVLVLFYADWCRYCIKFMPIFEKVSNEYKEDLVLAKVNVEDAKYKKVVEEARLTGFPTIMLIDKKYDNKVSIPNTYIGTYEDLSSELDRFIRIRKLLDKK